CPTATWTRTGSAKAARSTRTAPQAPSCRAPGNRSSGSSTASRSSNRGSSPPTSGARRRTASPSSPLFPASTVTAESACCAERTVRSRAEGAPGRVRPPPRPAAVPRSADRARRGGALDDGHGRLGPDGGAGHPAGHGERAGSAVSIGVDVVPGDLDGAVLGTVVEGGHDRLRKRRGDADAGGDLLVRDRRDRHRGALPYVDGGLHRLLHALRQSGDREAGPALGHLVRGDRLPDHRASAADAV